MAREHQMPKATLETALKKAVGGGSDGTEDLHSSVYEGLAPPGVAIIIEALTDNKNRTFAEIRHALTKRGGSMTPVSYLFTKRGRIVFGAGSSGHSLSEMEENAIEAEVEDIVNLDETDQTVEVYCGVKDVLAITKKLSKIGYEMKEFEMAYISSEKVDVPEDAAENFGSLLDQLEGMDDVVKVHHNAS